MIINNYPPDIFIEINTDHEWQSIETAPKDGTSILLYCPEDDVVDIGFWNPRGDSWVEGKLVNTGSWTSRIGWFQPDEVSHWMPLPKKPTK